MEIEGGLYHVTARGNARQTIYHTDADRMLWLETLAEVCQRFNWKCHAYCQMLDHYHVLVETPDANLSRGMRHLNGVYTQRINRRHGRSGHVLQGRYQAVLVEKESHLLGLTRHVVLNPVRAGMVIDVLSWPWSSCRSMVGREPAPPWLHTEAVTLQFNELRRDAWILFEDYVRAGVGLPSIWGSQRHPILLGSDAFVDRMLARLPQNRTLAEVPRVQRRPVSPPLDYYLEQPDRRSAMGEAYISGSYLMREIAERFNVHYSTVSRAVRAFQSQSDEVSPDLAE